MNLSNLSLSQSCYLMSRGVHISPTDVNLSDPVLYDVTYSRFGRFPRKAGSRIEDQGFGIVD